MPDPSTHENFELFRSRDQIDERIQQMGAEISRDFAGQTLVLVGVLNGAAIFLADLARAITVECAFDFVSVASYGMQQHSRGDVRLLQGFEEKLENRNVLIVEDILDTGATLCYLRDLLLAQKPAVLRIAALLDKPSRRVEKIEADYVGFTIPNRFAVGYGLDCANRFRNLPDIYFVSDYIQ